MLRQSRRSALRSDDRTGPRHERGNYTAHHEPAGHTRRHDDHAGQHRDRERQPSRGHLSRRDSGRMENQHSGPHRFAERGSRSNHHRFGGPNWSGAHFNQPHFSSTRFGAPQFGRPQLSGSHFGGSHFGRPNFNGPHFGGPHSNGPRAHRPAHMAQGHRSHAASRDGYRAEHRSSRRSSTRPTHDDIASRFHSVAHRPGGGPPRAHASSNSSRRHRACRMIHPIVALTDHLNIALMDHRMAKGPAPRTGMRRLNEPQPE